MNHSLKLFFLILSLLLGASEGVRLWWFSSDRDQEPSATFLKWNPPASAVDRNLAETRGGKVLAYDSGIQVLTQSDQSPISSEVIYLEYEKGNPRTLLDLFLHSPEICLPASGAKFIQEFSPHTIIIADAELKVRHWLFQHPLTRDSLHAFKLIWSHQSEFFKDTHVEKNFINTRLKAAASGQEFPASRMILAVTTGAKNEITAWESFQKETLSLLEIENSSAP